MITAGLLRGLEATLGRALSHSGVMAEGTRDLLGFGGPSTASFGKLLCAQLCIFWVLVQFP